MPWESLFAAIDEKCKKDVHQDVRVITLYLLRTVIEVAGEHLGAIHK